MSRRTRNAVYLSTLTFAITLSPALQPAHADTITVCWDGSGDYLTIQEGIDAAVDGDEVVVCDGTYTGPGNKDLDFHGKAITARSANGPENCIIDCEHDGRGFRFTSGESTDSVVDGFTITNGVGYADAYGVVRGGAIYCDDAGPTIRNCIIVGNAATSTTYAYGGAIYCAGGAPIISSCRITANTVMGVVTSRGGGIYCDQANPSITDCWIEGNSAMGYGLGSGGGLHFNNSTPTILRCTINENAAQGPGGGVYCSQSESTISECTISGNTAHDRGGGIYCLRGTATIGECVIANNASEDRGGGVYCDDGAVTIQCCEILENAADYYGGGVYCGSQTTARISGSTIAGNWAGQTSGGVAGGDLMMTDSTVADNSSLRGGGITCGTGAVLLDCNITGNVAVGRGGGVRVRGAAYIAGCTINSNSAGSGGGIDLDNISSPGPTITGCEIYDNQADNGGGICSANSVGTISECVISGNTAYGDGGGIYQNWALVIRRCAVTGNKATEKGAGIYSRGSGTIADCTITANSGNDGAGVFCWHGAPTIVNSIIAGNSGFTGGAAYADDTELAIANCTIVGNTATSGRTLACDSYGSHNQSTVTVMNCILQNGGDEIWNNDNSTIALTYSIVEGGWNGIGNIDADPLFMGGPAGAWTAAGAYDSNTYQVTLTDTAAQWTQNELAGKLINPDTTQALQFPVVANTATTITVWADWQTIDAGASWVLSGASYQIYDYHLTAGASPCIDAGCNGAVPADTADLDEDGDTDEITPLDLDGEGRFVDDPDTLDTGCGFVPIVDMGAYEYGDTGLQPCPGDMDGDRQVNQSDLGMLLSLWGASEECDLNCDGVIDQADLGILLAHWGEGCP